MQTSYALEPAVGIAGEFADTGPTDVRTYNNPALVEFGRALEKIPGDDDGVRHPSNAAADIVGLSLRNLASEYPNYPAKSAVAVLKKGRVFVDVEEAVTPDSNVFVRFDGKDQVQTLVLDNDLVTANVISVDVDGVTVSETFAIDHSTTMNAFAAKIAAEPGVSSAVVGGAGNREITITSASRESNVTLANANITLGASQANITITETVARVSNNDRGLFRSDDDSSTAVQITRARFLTSAAAGETAVLDVDLT